MSKKNRIYSLSAFLLASLICNLSFAQNAPSKLRNIVPAASVEQQGTQAYEQIIQEAKAKNKLLPITSPLYIRVNKIAQKLIPKTNEFNTRAKDWKWQINVIQDEQANAFCLPGGKIAVYSGIIEKLNATDAEIATVMGHEMAHALQEHAREQLAKNNLTGIGANLLGQVFGLGDLGKIAIDAGAKLLSLKFSRDDESDADIVGLNLAAKAGYDPRASIVLWQKMGKLQKTQPPQWISTHPIGANRIKLLTQKLPTVMPLFAKIAPTAAKQPYISNDKQIANVK